MDSIKPPKKSMPVNDIEPLQPVLQPQVTPNSDSPTGNLAQPPLVPKKKRNILKILTISLIVLAIMAAAAIGGLYLWYKSQLQPVSGREIAIEFVIEPGTGAIGVADQLESKGLIRSSRAFQFYLNQRGDAARLHAGTYLLSPSLSVAEVADVLVDGKTAQKLITIAPGLHLGKLKTSLVKQGFDAKTVDQALARKDLLPGLKPADASLEGYLFPESYSMPLDVSADDVVERAAEYFAESITVNLRDNIAKSGLSFHEAVTLASIIQGETDDPVQQKNVSAVFLNRLRKDMPLGADPTFRYAAYLKGVPESPAVDSPYNTRINKGLPPGPISNFKITALESVVAPVKHSYLFFVTGDDGKFHYSDTLKEHAEKASKYCVELCKL